MPKKRITLSLDTDVPSDQAILDFLAGLPKRTRSEIMKEILFDTLGKRDESPHPDSPRTTVTSGSEEIDPDEIIEKLF